MALSAGARLGSYEVIGAIGAGGMGEVYRARDTKLNRDVALKVLPDAFTLDPDRLARFKREAQVLASLNHPNIAAIYGFEDSSAIPALVLELVEGPTLAERLEGPRAKGSGLPVEEALRIACRIAEAVEAAHERGIVHRDLKPANIKITASDAVKVLDFGLAKALAQADGREEAGAQAEADLANSPTLTGPTVAGVILGTAAYMSPEQARGKPVDRRTDIWAFGCVLFEMLTGRRAFGGSDVAETIAAVVRDEPEWQQLPAETPSNIRTLLKRCLQKDRERRLPHIGVARIEITDPPAEIAPRADAVATGGGRARGKPYGWIAAAVLLVTTVALATVFVRQAPVDDRVYRTSVLPPDEVVSWSAELPPLRFALSPDGRRLAFLAVGRDRRTLAWVRPLDSFVAKPLPGTDGARALFWSPDSRFIAFIAQGKLKKIDAAGGPPIVLADAQPGLSPGAWGPGDVILFAADRNAGLFRISASGGTAAPVTTLDADAGENRHSWPAFLPDGRHFLYEVVGSKEGGPDFPRAVLIGSLDAGEKSRVLMETGSNAKYAQGHVLFMRGRTLMAQPFDAARLEFTGEATPVADQVQTGGSSRTNGAFFVSEGGVLAYLTGEDQAGSLLTWFDRGGKQTGVLAGRGRYRSVQLDPSGSRASVVLTEPGGSGGQIWLIDLARGVRTRFTLEGSSSDAVWSADSSRILFNMQTIDSVDLYIKAADGSGNTDTVLAGGGGKIPYAWSHDGRFVLYAAAGPNGSSDLWVLPLSGDRKPVPFMQSRFSELAATFSPDDRWVAYRSNESGSSEVYVAPFPATGAKTLVSSGSAGFGHPEWRRDGKELFYLAADGTIMAADVDGQGPDLKVGGVTPLFKVQPVEAGSPFGVTGDGQRFLVNVASQEAESTPITLVVNWTAGLRKP